jgi:hypothetical protein
MRSVPLASCFLASQTFSWGPLLSMDMLYFRTFHPFPRFSTTIFPCSCPSSLDPPKLKHVPIASHGHFQYPSGFCCLQTRQRSRVLCHHSKREASWSTRVSFAVCSRRIASLSLSYLSTMAYRCPSSQRLKQMVKMWTESAKGRTRFLRRARLDLLTNR